MVARHLARVAPTHLRWALGGRNSAKLTALRAELGRINPDLAGLPLLLGDNDDAESMHRVAVQARVVCSTVGPYLRYGTPLVRACVEAGTHYCDLSAEIPWIRWIVDRFHEEARRKRTRIVPACGFDAIPSDLGTLALQEHALQAYGRYCSEVTHAVGPILGGVSGGTVASLLGVLDHVDRHHGARGLLRKTHALVPGFDAVPAGPEAPAPEWHSGLKCWTVPTLMGSINANVVNRSNALLGFAYGRSFRYREAARVATYARAALMKAGLHMAEALVSLRAMRNVLRRVLPKRGRGPSEWMLRRGYFRSALWGVVPARNGEPSSVVCGTIQARGDPGYSATSRMLAESALLLALDLANDQGGVLTPAVAFGLPLVERLYSAGIAVNIVTRAP